MNKCDICNEPSPFNLLKKIEIDWNGKYKMVCSHCIEERGAYMIACRIDKPLSLQNSTYKKIKNANNWYNI